MMKKTHLSGVFAALVFAVVLLPEPLPAQVRGGLRDNVGSLNRGGFRPRGRVFDSRVRDRVRFRTNFGIWLGPTWWDPWWWGPSWYSGPSYYPYPYRYPYRYRTYDAYDRYDTYDYYRPPAAVQPPPAYDQQAPESPAEQSYWYRCESPAGYYPYVQQCPGGWTKVPHSPETAPPPASAPGEPPAAESQQPPDTAQPGDVPEEYRWYYCQDPQGYYPYVRDCPGGWNAVSPAPGPSR